MKCKCNFVGLYCSIRRVLLFPIPFWRVKEKNLTLIYTNNVQAKPENPSHIIYYSPGVNMANKIATVPTIVCVCVYYFLYILLLDSYDLNCVRFTTKAKDK